jgi:hypothetical protein
MYLVRLTPDERDQHIRNIRQLDRPAVFKDALLSLVFVFKQLQSAGMPLAKEFLYACDNQFLLLVRSDGYKLAKRRKARTSSGARDGIVTLPATSGLMKFDDEQPRLLAWRTKNETTQTVSVTIRSLTESIQTGQLPLIRRCTTASFADSESHFDAAFLSGVGKVIDQNRQHFTCVFTDAGGVVRNEWQPKHLQRMYRNDKRGHRVREFERRTPSGGVTTVSAHHRGGTKSTKNESLNSRTQSVSTRKYFRA